VIGYQFNWGVIGQYRWPLLEALALSVEMAAFALPLGLTVGLVIAYLSRARGTWLRVMALGFVSMARNTPLLLLVFIVYLVLPQYGFRGWSAKATFVIALSIVAAGYIAENFRAALATIPAGYLDGAKAVGLNSAQRQIYVVLPIALRFALPSLTNSAVAVFKDTSLASIIAIHELTFVAREITTNTFLVFEAWATVAILYLIVTSLMTLVSRALERCLRRLS
jgi:His/Glu/Gln/Arg/opine family amino acid ABC transporter permease subunit